MVAAAPGSRAPRGFVRQLRLAALALAVGSVVLASTLMGKQQQTTSQHKRVSDSGGTKLPIGWAGHALRRERPPSGLLIAEAQEIATDNSGNMIWVSWWGQACGCGMRHACPCE